MAAISVPGVFDFGGGTLYTGSETVYDVDHTDIWGGSGYGWTTSPTGSAVRAGSDDLERDFTYVTSGSITWRVEIANGTYDLEILMADYNYDRLGMNVQIDGAGAVYRTGARQANDEAARVFIPGHVVSGGQIDFVFSFESPGTLALVSGIRITNAAGGKVNLTVPAVIDAGYGDLYTGSETVYAAQLGNWAPNLDGHGFVAAEEAVLSTSRASGSNLEKDFLFVADSANTMTYRLNLANGDYNLEVYIGDTGGSASNVQLYVDGALEDTVSFSSNVQTISFSKTVTSGYIDLTFDSNGAAYCPFVGAKVEAAGGGTSIDAAAIESASELQSTTVRSTARIPTSGIESTSELQSTQATATQRILASATESSSSLGGASLTYKARLAGSALDSGSALQATTLRFAAFVASAGIESSSELQAVTLESTALGVAINAAPIESTSSLGAASLTYKARIVSGSLESGVDLGLAKLLATVRILAGALDSSSTLGTVVITAPSGEEEIMKAKVDVGTSGVTEIVAASSGQVITVVGMRFLADWESTAGSYNKYRWLSATTPITGWMVIQAGEEVNEPNELTEGYLETSSGEALNLELTGALYVGGNIRYTVA